MRLRFTVILIVLITSSWNLFAEADPLLLTPREEAKLRQYFPDDVSHLVWHGKPLAITLPIGKEKRLVFPTTVEPNLYNALTTAQLKIINDDKTLYLTALQAFPTTRLFVTVKNTGEVILIDLSAAPDASSAKITITIRQDNGFASITAHPVSSSTTDSVALNSDSSIAGNDAAVTLIRFAWQQLYAPKRLLKNQLGIMRAPMHTDYFLSDLVYGDKVYAHPEISWQYQNTYVTAILLRNKYPHTTRINLTRDLCGNWLAASLYPRSTLLPAGKVGSDSTTLFLISAQPFSKNMEVCNGAA